MVTNINWKIGRNIGCPFLDKFAKTAISFLLLGKMEECGKVEADPLICIRSSPQDDLSTCRMIYFTSTTSYLPVVMMKMRIPC